MFSCRTCRDNRSCHREASLLISDLPVIVSHGNLGDNLCTFISEVNNAKLRVPFQGHSVHIGNRHINGRLGLNFLSILLDFDVEEPGKGHVLAADAEPGGGIRDIAGIILLVFRNFCNLQLRPVRNIGFPAVAQGDPVGSTVDGGVVGDQGIAENILCKFVRGKAEAMDIPAAVRPGVSVQLQAFGNILRLAVLNLIQPEIPSGQILGQVNIHVEAFILVPVHIVQPDAEGLPGSIAARLFVSVQALHGGNGAACLLVRQDFRVSAGFLRQVVTVDGADGRLVVFRSKFCVACSRNGNHILPAVLLGHGQGLGLFGFLQDPELPALLVIRKPEYVSVGNFDVEDPRQEFIGILRGNNFQAGQDLYQRNILRTGESAGKLLVLVVVYDRVRQHKFTEVSGGEGETGDLVVFPGNIQIAAVRGNPVN